MEILVKPHSFAPRPLIFKVQQDSHAWWVGAPPKNGDKCSKLRKFWERQFFSSIVTLK